MLRLATICAIIFFSQAAHAECGNVPQPWRHAFSELCGKEVTKSKHIDDFPEKLAAMNREVNKNFYTETSLVFRKINYWAAPSEFYKWGGMCREFAVAKYYRLAKLGIADTDMRIDVVHLKSGEDHALLEMQYEGNVYVLDNRDNVVHDLAFMDDMEMLFAVNRIHVWGVDPTKYAQK
jgi:predicted transglutaminase-like cysteine proteinase